MRFDRKQLLLYGVTDRSWLNGQTLYEQVRQALEGGVSFLQLREKNLSEQAFLEEAKEIQKLCREYKVPFIINDNVDLALEIDADGAREMAKRSRGTPRLANRLLKRVRDFAQVKYDGKITKEVADFALELLEVDRYGLDQTDRKILEMIIQKFNGGPVGLDTLAAAIGEDAGTIEDVYEPYLIQYGFLNRTPRGRVATELAYHHLGI